jgi:hypothetical protein
MPLRFNPSDLECYLELELLFAFLITTFYGYSLVREGVMASFS